MTDVAEGGYEALRAANMKRNQEIMRALGLNLFDFKLHDEHKAMAGKKMSTGSAKRSGGTPRKRKLPEDGLDDAGVSSPATTRKSSRIRGLAPEGVDADGGDTGPGELRPVDEELCELHEAAERDHLRWAGRQGKATIVGTASYRHTLHRVTTMSPAALARRIVTIEKACGKYAVVKMRLFARVLCLEGYEELAADATAAFERLVAKLGEPNTEDEGE
jgi:hypothetical protein